MKGGMLVTNPIPEEYAMPLDTINAAIGQALKECEEKGIHGKETTPFLLARVAELTGGNSLASNIRLVYNNAALAAKTAVACKAL
jgi:pseudouridine-5'-phosphate glycosidase